MFGVLCVLAGELLSGGIRPTPLKEWELLRNNITCRCPAGDESLSCVCLQGTCSMQGTTQMSLAKAPACRWA
jgi:hypothetical protein